MTTEQKQAVMSGASRIISEVTGKNERYTMVLMDEADGMMGGEQGPATFIDVRGIGGMHDAVNERLSRELCELCQEQAGVDPGRLYLNFSNVRGHNWGWDGRTFNR